MKKVNDSKTKILVRINKDHTLVDRRMGYRLVIFGTVEKVAKQYGLKLTECSDGLKIEGRTNRMEIFVQRLHFAAIPYREITF